MPLTSRITGFGSNIDTWTQVDPTHDALRTSPRPVETQTDPQGPAGGHFSINAQSGTMAAGIASAAQVFQVRWAPSSTILFGLKKLKIQASTLTGFAATALGAPLQLFLGHGSTANGAGGTLISFGGNTNRHRASMAPSAFTTTGEVRAATTAALTAATNQGLEGNPIGGCMGAPNAAISQSPEMYLWDLRDAGDHPILLLPGDTLAVLTLNPAATGTWVFTVTMDWFETVTY
jgi:hypothetical protein